MNDEHFLQGPSGLDLRMNEDVDLSMLLIQRAVGA